MEYYKTQSMRDDFRSAFSSTLFTVDKYYSSTSGTFSSSFFSTFWTLASTILEGVSFFNLEAWENFSSLFITGPCTKISASTVLSSSFYSVAFGEDGMVAPSIFSWTCLGGDDGARGSSLSVIWAGSDFCSSGSTTFSAMVVLRGVTGSIFILLDCGYGGAWSLAFSVI